MNYLSGQYGMSYHRVSHSQSVYTSTKLSTSDYYPFGSLMPGRTVMDTTVHCVDMTQIDRVWQPAYENGLPFNSLFSEMSPWGAASYELSSDHGQLDLFIEDEQSGIKLLLDSGIGSGSLVLEGKVSNISDRGIVLRVQGVDAEGNGVVYHQEHLGQFDGKMEIPLDSAYSDYVVNIQGLLQWSILGNTVMNGHWVETEVLVRVCDEVGDKYRFGFNGQEKVNEIAGMGNHNTAEFWEYDTRLGRRWNIDPKTNESISTYATFAGNPNLFVDPLGDTVWIYKYFHKPSHGYNYLQTHKVEYRDKWLFSEDGVRLKAISDPYLREVLTTLNNLQDISIEAGRRLGDMMRDKAPHIISNMDLDSKIEEKMKGRGNYNRSIIENDPSKGTITRWNKKDVSINYTPEASLAHEILSHGYNRAKNKFRNKQVINNLGIKFSEDEWDAINLSNQILYNQKIKFNKKLKLIKDYSGVPIPESEFKQPKENDIPN